MSCGTVSVREGSSYVLCGTRHSTRAICLQNHEAACREMTIAMERYRSQCSATRQTFHAESPTSLIPNMDPSAEIASRFFRKIRGSAPLEKRRGSKNGKNGRTKERGGEVGKRRRSVTNVCAHVHIYTRSPPLSSPFIFTVFSHPPSL